MPKGNQKLFEFLDPLQWQKAFLKEFFGDIVLFATLMLSKAEILRVCKKRKIKVSLSIKVLQTVEYVLTHLYVKSA